MPANPEKYERMLVAVPPEMREMIRRWRHRNMIETESEAVRQLLMTGLEAGDTAPRREPITKRGRSPSASTGARTST